MRPHTLLAIIATVSLDTFGPAHAGCNPAQLGTAACPEFTAPATTAVPGPSIDGSLNTGNNNPVVLFGGKVPPNGYMVQILANGESCFINDDGPAGPPANVVSGGFLLPNGFAVPVPAINAGFPPPPVATFVTPPGYKPMGPVSVWCAGNGAAIEARSW